MSREGHSEIMIFHARARQSQNANEILERDSSLWTLSTPGIRPIKQPISD